MSYREFKLLFGKYRPEDHNIDCAVEVVSDELKIRPHEKIHVIEYKALTEAMDIISEMRDALQNCGAWTYEQDEQQLASVDQRIAKLKALEVNK